MKKHKYDFVDLDSIEALQLIGDTLGGKLEHQTLYFDNEIAKGYLELSMPEPGMWLRKWKLTAFEQVVLNKQQAPAGSEKKVLFIYFLNPALFTINNKSKKVAVNDRQNNLFLTSDTPMEFSVLPKQPFFVLDIAVSASLLSKHFHDAEPSLKESLNRLIQSAYPIIVEPCCAEEYETLRELDISVSTQLEDKFYIRSRIYCLIVHFFSKMLNRSLTNVIQNAFQYEQVMQAEELIRESVQQFPKVESIAKAVNMSVSSLLRQFKLMYKKSIQEYHIEKKMELAKKMILETGISIRDTALHLGYKQASAFIEIFTKHYGYSPGTLKRLAA